MFALQVEGICHYLHCDLIMVRKSATIYAISCRFGSEFDCVHIMFRGCSRSLDLRNTAFRRGIGRHESCETIHAIMQGVAESEGDGRGEGAWSLQLA